MIPESELVACRDCGVVFWAKAKAAAQSRDGMACPACKSRRVDDITRST